MRGLIAAAVAAAAVAAPAARADTVPEYFNLPAPLKMSLGLDVAPDGTVYFGTDDGTQRPPIGRLDPAAAVPGTANGITPLTTPPNQTCCATQIRDVAFAPALNTLWWTRSDGVVGRLDGATMTSTSTSEKIAPWGIAAASDGSAWFTEIDATSSPKYLGDRIAQVSPAFGIAESTNIAFQSGTFDSIRYDAKPMGIALAPDGSPWFTESDNGNPGYRIAHAVGAAYTEYELPCIAVSPCSGTYSGTGPADIAVAADGTVWYSNRNTHAVGHLDPATRSLVEYPLQGFGSGLGAGMPRGLTVASDGSVWLAVFGSFSAPGANAIVKLVPGPVPTATAYRLGAALAPWEVAADPHGNVWFTGSPNNGQAAVGRLTGVVAVAPAGSAVPVTATPPASTPIMPSIVATAKITDPQVHGTSVTANQICVGPPQDRCSLVYLIQTHEYVAGLPGSKGSAARAKPKLVTIGKATVTLSGGQSRKVTVKLNATGRKLVKKAKKLKATLTVTQSRNGAKPASILKKSLTFRR